jgi:hypothetical protein
MDLEAELGRTHKLNIKLRELILRTDDETLIAKSEKLVKECSQAAFEANKREGTHAANDKTRPLWGEDHEVSEVQR